MKIITINPKDDPRRAEYWVGMKIQIPHDLFSERIKSFISETEEVETIYEVANILKYAYESQFEPGNELEPQIILGIGEIAVDGNGRVNGAYYHLIIQTDDGEVLYRTKEGYSLQDDFYNVPQVNPYDELWDPVGNKIDEFLKENEEICEVPLEDINYDPGYISKGSVFTYNKRDEDDGEETKPKKKKKHPRFATFPTIQLESPPKFEHEPESDIVITFDREGNFQATSVSDWEEVDIIKVMAIAISTIAKM